MLVIVRSLVSRVDFNCDIFVPLAYSPEVKEISEGTQTSGEETKMESYILAPTHESFRPKQTCLLRPSSPLIWPTREGEKA